VVGSFIEIVKTAFVLRRKTKGKCEMPYTLPNGKRDYKRQGALVDSKPEAREHRAAGVKIQRAMEKVGRAKKGDGLDNAHKVAFSKGGGATLKNVKVQKPSKNRSFKRNSDSSMK